MDEGMRAERRRELYALLGELPGELADWGELTARGVQTSSFWASLSDAVPGSVVADRPMPRTPQGASGLSELSATARRTGHRRESSGALDGKKTARRVGSVGQQPVEVRAKCWVMRRQVDVTAGRR